MVGTHVTVDVEKAHRVAAHRHAMLSQRSTELDCTTRRSQTRQLAS